MDCSNGAISVQSQEINVRGTSYKESLSEFFHTLINIAGVLRFFHCSHAMEHEHGIPIESICSKRDRNGTNNVLRNRTVLNFCIV